LVGWDSETVLKNNDLPIAIGNDYPARSAAMDRGHFSIDQADVWRP